MAKDFRIWLFIFLGVLIIALIGLLIYIPSLSNASENATAIQFIFPIVAILAIVISILTLSIISLVFTYSKTEYPYALGMPQGSVRALIALALLISFVISAIFLFSTLKNPATIRHNNVSQSQLDQMKVSDYRIIKVDSIFDKLDSIRVRIKEKDTIHIDSLKKPIFSVDVFIPENDDTSKFANQLLTIFGTLVIAVSAFYFGSRASEQGAETAVKIFNAAATPTNPAKENIPEEIIKEAIEKNRKDWITKYEGTKDIIPGTKKTGSVTSGVNCIVFKVEKKINNNQLKELIPKTFKYTAINGNTYDIPTDVIEDSGSTTVPQQEIQVNEPVG